ncbi:DNA polymerase III subunit gamma/tau [Fischerella thermalis]|uniref:DNA polymerase III subunit gamma/tau n=1 Tax=Fischerella thermalis CCMEE 5318 TaxID=2019666 RepID=A0A2N6LGG2_9CYAN|nr:DNA polymerase III subunit gamma/tau [Fischerella thermalis]PMB22908.1 DNA polymerase III subunit gamma/tau [Fischerella thermalis CCMEE 5318]
MSYEPLHHKYRPKSFAELVGQEAIATTLTNAIRASKIAPAYLFTGPRGTGKTSSARILAKSLNCLKSDKPTAEPCGVCDVCQGITKGYSLDVIEIDAASNTGVDNIREIIERAQFAPVQCRYKVYVVDECHMLSTAAFNALLKTLEEPPKHVVFVLATTDPQRVLPTIISRCQRFDFRRIPLEAMVQHLSTIATKENININPEAITLVAQIAQGGLRDAESLLDQLSLLSGEVTPDQVWDLVGSVSERDLLTLLGAIATDNPEAVLDCTRQILDRGREPLIILQNLAALYRDLLIAKTAPSRQNLVACTPQTWQALVSFAQQLDISTILQGQQHLRTAEVQLKNTTQPRLWLEVTLLGLLPSATISTQPSTTNRVTPAVSSTPSIPPSPVSNGKVTQIQRDTGNQQNTTTQQHSNNEKSSLSPPTPPTPPPSEQKELNSSTQESLEATWQKIVESLPIPAKALLNQHGRLLSIGDNAAVVGVPPKLIKLAQGKLADVEAAFVKVFQQKYKVSLVANQGKPAPSNEKKEILKKNTPQAHQPPLPSYNQQQPPVVENHQPVKPVITKTESVTNAAVASIPPPQPQMPSANWESDEAAIAAQRLAQFFDGEIIRFADDVVEFTDSSTTSEWENEGETDDDF